MVDRSPHDIFMSPKNKKQKSRSKVDRAMSVLALLTLPICFILVMVGLLNNVFNIHKAPIITPALTNYDKNADMEQYVTEFFTSRGAEEMVSIIGCESEFKHFNQDGSVLKNREGSSATGVAQIMASAHPDPNVIRKYNRKNNTNLTVDNFDINTMAGNVAYAHVLYEVRGTKDWECANKI
jgi:hypothetical protein